MTTDGANSVTQWISDLKTGDRGEALRGGRAMLANEAEHATVARPSLSATQAEELDRA
jgi:hypothetical protein